jgi:hypothetical protein
MVPIGPSVFLLIVEIAKTINKPKNKARIT